MITPPLLPIKAPTACPDCDSDIVELREPTSGITTHWCENVECPGRIADTLTFVADRSVLEIEGMGPEMAALLARDRFVVTLPDLFEFCAEARRVLDTTTPERFAEEMNRRGIPGAALIRVIETVERSKTATWDRWIAALGIPMIGRSLGKKLAGELGLTSDSMDSLPEWLALPESRQIEGIGFHKRAELLRHAHSTRFQLITKRLFAAGVRPTPVESTVALAEGAPLAGMVFLITGEFYDLGSRDYVTGLLVKLGAVSKTGVSKKITHLLVGTEPGSSKLRKAEEQKVPTFDEAWLRATLEQHGAKAADRGLDMEWAD